MEVSGQLHDPAALPPGKSPWYPRDRRLGGPHCHSGRGGIEKIPNPYRESNPRTPIVQPVAQHYTDWAITAPVTDINNSYFMSRIVVTLRLKIRLKETIEEQELI
jgi:hypothetical protein